MKLIILAAGEGSRLKPITNTIPKPLIKIVGKTIIEHNLESIISKDNKNLFDEIIFIVKYQKEKIIEYFGNSYNGIKVSYKTQGDKKGTGAALMGLDILDDILIINGDNIFEKKDLDKILNYNGYGVLVKRIEDPENYGIFDIKPNGEILKIVEKPKNFIGDLANLGCYKLSSNFLKYIENIALSPRGEYENIDALNEFALHYPLKAIEIQGDFLDIGSPWKILEANKTILDKLEKSDIKGEIEENVVIKGNIILEKGSILKSGTYIEGNCYIGENTSIGPNIYLKGTISIGNNCKIGANNEIKDINIGDNTNVSNLNYIGDSIIGNNINITGDFITSKNDTDSNVFMEIKGKNINTNLKQLGVIIGGNNEIISKTNINSGYVINNK